MRAGPLDVEQELARFDADLAVERAHTPPESWYLATELFERERASVFHDNWIAVGRADQADAPGRYFTGELLGAPFVVVRGDDRLRAFHNVCRHHAAVVASGSGSCEELVCPYHGWAYGLDGKLVRAPRVGGIEDFDRARIALPPIAATTLGPVMLLDLSQKAPEPDAEVTGLMRRLDVAHLVFRERRLSRIACNWKVFVDNYLDGGYHVAPAHPELDATLDGASYRTEISRRHVLQSCRARSGDARLGAEARYAFVYPNWMLNRYGPVLDVNVVLPLSASETLVVLDWWFEPDRAEDASFVAASVAASMQVQAQDVALCESVQKGLASGSYASGRYAPRVEAGMHHFHRLLSADLSAPTAVDRAGQRHAAYSSSPPA